MPTLLNAGQSPFGWHRMQAFMQCPTKYYYSYISEEHTRTVSPSLIVGSLLHTGLAHKYAIMGAEQRGEEHDLYDPSDAIRQQAKEEGEVWQSQLEKVFKVYNQYAESEYIRFWESDFIIISVEDIFTLTIDGYDLTLRADLVIQSKSTGLIYFVDHKTSSYIREVTTKGYQSSGQFIAYQVLGENLWKDKFGGLIINYLQHGGFTAKNPRIAFKQVEVKRSQSHIDAFAPSILFYRKLIEHYQDKDLKHFPRVQTEFTCIHKYGACDHYDKCFNTTNNTNKSQ